MRQRLSRRSKEDAPNINFADMDDANSTNKFEGARIVITSGRYRGREGVCVGKSQNATWAVAPDGSNDIVYLRFENDFSLLIDLSSDPARN
jgi:hypothetical protein